MSRSPSVRVLTLLTFTMLSAPVLAQHDEHKHPTKPAPAAQPTDQATPAQPATKPQTPRPSDPYPLATCPISGMALGEMGEPVVKEYDGREVRFCCDACIAKFEAAKDDHWKKIDDQIVKAQTPFYPLTTCIISSKPLTEGGKDIATNYVYRNRLIRLCSRSCITEFLKDPEASLKKLDAAVIAQQRERYPLATCLVSGEELGSMGDPVEVVIGNRLVRICCAKCEKDLRARPAEFLSKVDEAWKSKGGLPALTDKVPADAKGSHQDHKPGDGHKHEHPAK